MNEGVWAGLCVGKCSKTSMRPSHSEQDVKLRWRSDRIYFYSTQSIPVIFKCTLSERALSARSDNAAPIKARRTELNTENNAEEGARPER